MKSMLFLALMGMCFTARAHLNHFTSTAGVLTTVGAVALFTRSGGNCVFDDPLTPAGSHPNWTANAAVNVSPGLAVCRMTAQSTRYLLNTGCAENATTGNVVCSGEVNPTNCTISAAQNQIRCI